MGHNDRLGWTLVTNAPDIADVWRVRFTQSRPTRSPTSTTAAGGKAEEWTETIRV